MDWIRVCIHTTTEGIEPVCGCLYQIGISGTEIEDEKDFKNFLEENTQFWDMVDDELIEQKKGDTKIKIYIPEDEFSETFSLVKGCLDSLKSIDDKNLYGTLDTVTDTLNEEDWANNWKKYFKPLEVGEKILIRPEWEEAAETDRTVFTVNPGLTFGTGTHHSTKLCIEEIEKYAGSSAEMIDIGCGSGILSVIALLLGTKSAVALDIDPNCVHVAYENAAKNGISKDRYTVLSGNILTDTALIKKVSHKRYDIVAANIVADVIIALLPTAKMLLKKDGVFICSGIISERLTDVTNALFSAGFEIVNEKESGGWAALTCKLM